MSNYKTNCEKLNNILEQSPEPDLIKQMVHEYVRTLEIRNAHLKHDLDKQLTETSALQQAINAKRKEEELEGFRMIAEAIRNAAPSGR